MLPVEFMARFGASCNPVTDALGKFDPTFMPEGQKMAIADYFWSAARLCGASRVGLFPIGERLCLSGNSVVWRLEYLIVHEALHCKLLNTACCISK